ncbi:hypothetical protein TWF569_005949 [Orbilia oligospora]|uniref:Uncharacterized protein n=1 Tax=Orbilia oligospora TaxID=2813651 RepID=A0A7C8NY30_ORBOL|nr:hypothetical protein TWF102_004883 [Orbilia oligospora]KAF3104262.1 hypothetical protein TWF103_006929 [Orbilia oligospora]KAF3108313.1 hypothetical protein TWF706_002200 [Orbilia oligospora]KAF3126512.1 hypothetical protein TWF594_001097 [Orbilia oligospora]KAF3146149.1 hypothetical protein TWF703_005695 [Orbilia oligospora]
MAPPLIPKPIERRQANVANPRAPQSEDPPSPTLPARPNPTDDRQDGPSPAPTRILRPSGSTTPTPTPTPTQSSSANNRNNGLNMTNTQSGIVITIVVIIGVIILAFLSYIILKSIRLRYKDPKYLPGSFLKKKWQNWDVMGYQAAGGNNSSGRPQNQARINRVARSRANIEANRALDRQNSVRSVITLPPYREMAEMDLERTIGREGEREGLDTIVQLPETAEEEEDRREERMQAMYELRLQRRAQRAARESRSGNGSVTTLGNEGNNNGNGSSVSLTAMDMEAGGSGRTASELTAAILNDRTRRLSEVSYGDVGYARHDGSRVRSTSTNRNNSTSSDSQPLLADNATAGTGRRSRAGSMLSLNTNVTDGRGSMDRRDSAELLTGADIGETRLPPSYDGLDWGDAPPYMSPISPPARNESAATRRRPVPGQSAEQPGNLNVPLVRVIGASNPSSPMSPRGPGQL